MANIKNFGLVGVGSDVQFGKSGPRLINETGVFKFKKADGIAFADATFANVTADELKGQVGKLVTVDASGKLVMGAVIDELATDVEVASAVAAEKALREAAEQAINDAIAAEALRADTAEKANKALIDAEKARAEAAEADLQEAIDALGTQVSEDLQAQIDAEEARALAAEKVIADALAAEVLRATGEEARIEALVTAEATRADLAEKANKALIDAEVARATAEEQDIRADFATADAAIRAEMQAAIAGITWENPVNQMVADLDARDALTLTTGARIYVASENKVFTKTADGFDAGELMVQGAAFFDRETTVPYVFNGTDMVQFNGAAGLSAGLGLIMNGNEMNLDLSVDGGLKFYPDAGNPNNTVGLKLADISLEVGTTGLKLSAALQTEIAALRTDLGAEVARATAAEGTLTTDLAAELARATAAEGVLAGRLDLVESKNTAQDSRLDDLEAKTGADSALLQAEVDFMEAALGLGEDGKLVAFTSTNYVAATDTFASAINKIDAALKAMEAAYIAADELVLQAAKDYTDEREVAILAVIDDKVTLLTDAIATAKAEAIAAAATDATTKANQALADAKVYTDSKISDQIGAANAARAVYASFNGADAVIGMVAGFVHRIKVYVTSAVPGSDALIQVGTATVNGQLATTADVDSSTAGLYTVEVNEVYATATELKVFVGGAAAGKVVVEYLA